jgi:hypothetical protein
MSNHDTEAQAQRAGQESIAILNAKVLLSRKETNEGIDTYDGGAEYTSYQAVLAR